MNQERKCPTPISSPLSTNLERLLKSNEGGDKEPPFDFSNLVHEKLVELLGSVPPTPDLEAKNEERWFNKLRKVPSARTKLENIHSARSFKYGAAQFGPKAWYRESPGLSKKLKSQQDRRKFRQGLKGNLEFLNQLNISDLEKEMDAGDPAALKLLKLQEPMTSTDWCEVVKDVPPLKLLGLINSSKATVISELIQRISSVAHFSQSMTDYFAHDDALEPALSVLCEVLRMGPNFGAVLKNDFTTFLGLAQKYQKLRSVGDRDFGRNVAARGTGVRARATARDRQVYTPRTGHPRYPLGFCFDFQEPGGCSRRKCTFKHKCTVCEGEDHGKCGCPQN